MKRAWKVGRILIVAAALASCQSKAPEISIENAKAELSPAVVGEAMVTMKIVNKGGADMLAAVRTNIPGATASFHVMRDRRMQAVDMMKVPSNGVMEFRMGSDHIMIENLPGTMTEGSPFTVTLVFEGSGEKQVALTLQKAPDMKRMEHGGHQM
jgi:copper(I)-binding protein